MKIRLTFILAIFVLFSGFRIAQAQVVINEVELNPTGARFIELYNTSNQNIDLTGWYIQRKTQNGTDFGSLVSKTNFKNKSIGANGFFLISRSAMNNTDIVLGDLTLTESNTIQLKNPKGAMIDKMAWGDGNIPNPSDGKSIQKISNTWIIASPTPRVLNVADVIVPIAPPIVPVQTVPLPKANTTLVKTNTTTPKVKTKITTEPQASSIPFPINLNSQNEANSQENSTDSYLFFGALAFFLILSGGAVYFIRQKKVIPKAGDDFHILEE